MLGLTGVGFSLDRVWVGCSLTGLGLAWVEFSSAVWVRVGFSLDIVG